MRLSTSSVAATLVVLMLVAAASPALAVEPRGNEWVEATYDLQFDSLLEFSTVGDLDVRRVEIGGERYDADDLRRTHATIKATQGEEAADKFVASFEAVFANALRANLLAAFPGAVVSDPLAEVVESSLAASPGGSATDPPVEVRITADTRIELASYGYEDLDLADIEALLEAGAALDTPIELFADPGHANVFHIRFPDGIAVDDAGSEVLTSSVDNTGGSQPKTKQSMVAISSEKRSALVAQVGVVEITLDIQDVDVTLAGAAAGDFGAMLIEATVLGSFDVVELPESTVGALPEGVHLELVAADGIRSLVARGLVPEKNLAEAAQEMTAIVDEGLTAMLGSRAADLRGDWVRASLEAGASGRPVVFEAKASLSRPLAESELQRGAAIALYSIPTTLHFTKFGGFDTIYKIVLPAGLATESATGEGVTVTERADGRSEITVSMVGEDSPETTTMTTAIAVTPTFVAIKFWPMLLVVALVVVGFLYLLVRTFRRR